MSITKCRFTFLVLIFITLAFNAYANTNLNANPNKYKTSNLVDIFKVEKQALKYIEKLEQTIHVNNGKEKESRLIELAQSLDYYLSRHKQKPQAKRKILNKMLDTYLEAAALSRQNNRIKYTREIVDLAVTLQKKAVLDNTFNRMLAHSSDTKGTYLALMDYADGLAKFKDNVADKYFQLAVDRRDPADGVEAHFRYARYLLNNNKAAAALNLLDKFSFDERSRYVHIAILRQKIMHLLDLDTTAVDAEIDALRRKMSQGAFIGGMPKVSAAHAFVPANFFALTRAYAFAHLEASDDSRGPYANWWLRTPLGFYVSRVIVNATEVLYNEARSESRNGRLAVAWVIRNRANINMNGCDRYPGAEGQGNVNACRTATPSGPQIHYAAAYKRYSCVIHGGTTLVGASHSQIKDNHVAIATLESSGLLWEIIDVFNGWLPDRTSSATPSGTFYPGLFYPYYNNVDSGNPAGAQEFRSINYCAGFNECKVRLGNIGGNLVDPGDLCPNWGKITTDNFFWGRKP